jgi:hypothetical protein
MRIELSMLTNHLSHRMHTNILSPQYLPDFICCYMRIALIFQNNTSLLRFSEVLGFSGARRPIQAFLFENPLCQSNTVVLEHPIILATDDTDSPGLTSSACISFCALESYFCFLRTFSKNFTNKNKLNLLFHGNVN